MKRRHVLTAAAALVLMAGLLYLNRAGQAPPGQAPVVSLTPENSSEVAKVFNAAMNDVRVVMLLSPT